MNRPTTAPGRVAASAAASVPVRQCRCGTRLARDRTGALCGTCESALRQRYAAPPQVPTAFWAHPPLAEALAARHMGRVQRAYRHHPWHGTAPLPQPVLGEWLGMTQAQVSRAENGPARRHLDWLTFTARQLRIPADRLWFAPDREPSSPPAAPTGAVAAMTPPMASAPLAVDEAGAVTRDQVTEATGAGGALLGAADARADLADRYRDQQHTAILAEHRARVPHRAEDGNALAGMDGAGLGVRGGQARDGWPVVQVVVSPGAAVTIEIRGRVEAGALPLRVVIASGPARSRGAVAGSGAVDGARVYSLAARRGRR